MITSALKQVIMYLIRECAWSKRQIYNLTLQTSNYIFKS